MVSWTGSFAASPRNTPDLLYAKPMPCGRLFFVFKYNALSGIQFLGNAKIGGVLSMVARDRSDIRFF
jgi:hypothetical protein